MEKFDKILKICRICGSKELSVYHTTSDHLKIFQCNNCKIQFLNPQYSDRFLTDMYSTYTIDQSAYESSLNRAHLGCLLMVEKYAKEKKALLDIGCGNGHLISLAHKRGWSPVGYDVAPDTVSQVSKKLGIKVVSGDFLQTDFVFGSFDAITMLHVIEHLKSPLDYLQRINELLKPGGVFFLALPNIRSRSALLKFLLEKMKIKRENIGGYYDTGHHLFYYTPETISDILKLNGFEIKALYDSKENDRILSKRKSSHLGMTMPRIFWSSTMSVIAIKK